MRALRCVALRCVHSRMCPGDIERSNKSGTGSRDVQLFGGSCPPPAPADAAAGVHFFEMQENEPEQ